MCEQRLVDSFNVGDREPDADGAGTSSASPTFGEHHARLRMVGAAFYIDDLTIPVTGSHCLTSDPRMAPRPDPTCAERAASG